MDIGKRKIRCEAGSIGSATGSSTLATIAVAILTLTQWILKIILSFRLSGFFGVVKVRHCQYIVLFIIL